MSANKDHTWIRVKKTVSIRAQANGLLSGYAFMFLLFIANNWYHDLVVSVLIFNTLNRFVKRQMQ